MISLVRKKYFLITIPILFLLLLVIADYVTYTRDKNTAIKDAASLNYLLPTDREPLHSYKSSGCNGSKNFWSVSVNCSANNRYEYTLGDKQVGEYFTSYEAAGWYAKGTIKESLLNNPASLSTPPCVTLYNDRLHPTEKARVQLCLHQSSVSITSYSFYRPSMLMSAYLWIRAQSSGQIQ